MIDTHAHFDAEAYNEDRNEVINEAFNNGIEAIIVPGIEPKTFDNVLALTEQYENIYCAIGIHPHNAKDADERNLGLVRQLSQREKVVAIGEIGLDYYYDFAPQDLQREVFRKQLKIAKEQGLPVIVHNREADEDTMKIIEDEEGELLTGVMHCFAGSMQTLQRAIDARFFISFTGNITFKKSTLSEIVAQTPMDRLLLETDSPYMTPMPFRGQRNKSTNLIKVAEKIAEIKKININEVIEMTTSNAKRLFRLMLIILAVISFTFAANAQSVKPASKEKKKALDEDYPSKKKLGFGFLIGTNTIVETQNSASVKNKDVTYEGIFAWGFGLYYNPLDFLTIEATYMSSKNNKINDGSNKHQAISLSALFSPNAYGRVNFYGIIGLAGLINDYAIGTERENNQFSTALHSGLGLNINVPTGIGLFTVVAEWSLLFFTSENRRSNLCENE